MKLPNVGAPRRHALLKVLALTGIAIVAPIKMFQQPPPEPMPHDPLLGDASEYLAGIFDQHGPVIVGPISLLQRHFSLGYGRAIALALNLEKLNVWSIYHDGAGMRSARRGEQRGERQAVSALR